MGGNLEVFSEIGKGSCFYFTIPCKLLEQSLEEIENKYLDYNDLLNWENKIMLIVEDVESNFQFLKNLLKKTGIQIFWATQGEEALQYCQKTKPDVVLMDIQLPGKNGYEVTREILQLYPKLPIIAQTAYAFSDEKEKILQAGCVEYLTKPLNKNLLMSVIQKYI
jgi:CheY-like chemotaxis protein